MDQEYDLIIVGAGTSGCVLANRLSEDRDVSILVVEAGEDHGSDERVVAPGLMGSVFGDSAFDWQYASQPEAGLNGRVMKHPRGRVLGGTSAINSLALIYPSATDIDAWEMPGIEGWNWKTLAPYFRKFQTITPPSQELKDGLNLAHTEDSIRTSSGPIQASFPVKPTEMQKAWDDTFRALRLQNSNDPLDGHSLGGHTSTLHVTGDQRERSHAGNAYLLPVLSRSNLTLTTGVLVNKLLIAEGEGAPVAYGIEYTQDGVLRSVSARREVILTAGTFNSPQILELSGIGNAEVLAKYGINVVAAIPGVGENLQDHIRAAISFETTYVPPKVPVDEARKLYEENRSGPWAEIGAFSFSYTPLAPFLGEDEMRELRWLVDKHVPSDDECTPFERKRNAFIRNNILSASEASAVCFLTRKPVEAVEGNFLTMNAMLSHPISAGSTHIVSSDCRAKPEIAFNYYANLLDLEVHARHVHILERIAKTEPLASFIKAGGRQLPQGYVPGNLESAKEICRGFTSTNYHPCGTCSLGAVVDSSLKVKGVRNLRVIDASVMPIMPRGNIITSVYAVAERGADIVSAELGIRRST